MESDTLNYLKNLPKTWWDIHKHIISVGRILEEEGSFHDRLQVHAFYEKPYNYQSEIDELIEAEEVVK